MSFNVIVRMQVRPERLGDALALIQREFARLPSQGQARNRARLYQRLGEPTDLLGVIEWTSEQAYSAYRAAPTHRAILRTLAGPSHAFYCARLSLYERAREPAEIMAVSLVTTQHGQDAKIEELIAGEWRTAMISAPGLVSHELYRTYKCPPSYVVVHQWRRFGDLEHFRTGRGAVHEEILLHLGAQAERYTGRLTIESPTE